MATSHNVNQGEVTLARTLSLFDATMIGLGAMIGAGVFVLTGIATGEAGPAAIIAFALNGIVTLFTAFSYAELASAIPEAGGGYSFVKRAMPAALGFLAGWMLWFAYTVACALYAAGFGGYFIELLSSYWPAAHDVLVGTLGHHGAIALATLVISAFFVTLNVLGADVTGKAENVVTMAKVIILGMFIAFGLVALLQRPDPLAAFFPLFPKGFGGVIAAMGLTFIAFEGYDLIATVSEEIKEPTKNIPRATFISLGAAVLIYLFILLVSIGAVDPTKFAVFGQTVDQLPATLGIAAPLDLNDPQINTAWEVLGIYKETGIVRAAENFMPQFGVALIVIGGLFSTMSALNATVLASSRVGFSMGRERMLPRALGLIHPRRRTPYVAVLVTGLIIVAIAVGLPLEVVGSGASLMFLLSFALTNAAMILIRVREPDLKRGYRAPFFPWLPILGIVSNLGLAVYQFTFQPMAWYVGLAWVALGAVVYLAYTVRAWEEKVPLPVKILHEERLVPRDYQVLIPLANEEQARLLGILGSAIAWAHDGEVLALHVVRVPVQLSMADGRMFLKEGRPILETAIRQAKEVDVPVHTMIRLDRHIDRAIRETARKRQVNLMLLGWPGYTRSEDRAFGSVIDALAQDPPCDLAVVRFRQREEPRSILLPTAGGLNAALALELAVAQAREFEHRTSERPRIVVFTVMRPGVGDEDRERLRRNVARLVNGVDYAIETRMATAPDVVEGILTEAEQHNLVIMGATEEGPFERLFFGTTSERVARQCPKTVIIAKRYRGPVRFWLHRLWSALTAHPPTNNEGSKPYGESE